MPDDTAAETEFVVVVPMKTTQTFLVTAVSAAAAKRKVTKWFKGLRDEGPDLQILDDIGMTSHRLNSRYWTVTTGSPDV